MNSQTKSKFPGKRSGGMTLLMVIVVIAFVAINNSQQVPDVDRSSNGSVGSSQERSPGGGMGSDQARSVQAEAGDWQMEEVETADRKAAETRSGEKRTSQGNWTLEEVPTKKRQPGGDAARMSDNSSNPGSRSTERANWRIEEVDKKIP